MKEILTDIETYGEVDLNKCGLYRYASDDSFEILLVAWTVNEGQFFVDAVKKAGGLALKFTSQGMNGVPDRLVLLPDGKAAFVELKAPGKQMRPQQRKRRKQLMALGFPVLCVDRMEQTAPVMAALQAWQPGEIPPDGIGAAIPEIQNVRLPEGGDAR